MSRKVPRSRQLRRAPKMSIQPGNGGAKKSKLSPPSPEYLVLPVGIARDSYANYLTIGVRTYPNYESSFFLKQVQRTTP
jgi:hypothetical protein